MPAHPPNLAALQGRPQRLTPPAYLSPALHGTFNQIVLALDAGHFRISDVDLLCAYVGAIHMEREARDHLDREGHVIDGKANAWLVVMERALRTMGSFSLRLRLSPQARFLARVAKPGPLVTHPDRIQRPWESAIDEREVRAS